MKTTPRPSPTPPIKLKVNLENMLQPVFRRILVPEDLNMLELHAVIQVGMGWEFEHLFQFSDKRYKPTFIASTSPENDFGLFGHHTEEIGADEVKLKEDFLIERDGKPFWYWYDFGDDWWHKVTFQKPTKKDLQTFTGVPVCVEAIGTCPPEDIGGPWGYAEFLDTVNNKKHPQYKEMREWAGLSDKYDAGYVDMESINEALTRLYKPDS